MEFLGDSVVNLCVAQALYERHPYWNEGDLTQVKSAVVSTLGLARAAESLRLRDVASFGKGLPRHEPLPPSVYANLFEAVTAAVYLDGGHGSRPRLYPARVESRDADAGRKWRRTQSQILAPATGPKETSASPRITGWLAPPARITARSLKFARTWAAGSSPPAPGAARKKPNKPPRSVLSNRSKPKKTTRCDDLQFMIYD